MKEHDIKTEPVMATTDNKEKESMLSRGDALDEIAAVGNASSLQQASLLDKLSKRLSYTQAELESQSEIIHAQEANRIVKNHVLAGSAMGLVPLPLFDLVALSGAQQSMLQQLSEHYGVDFDKNKAKSALISLTGGSIPTLLLLGLGSVTKLVPGAGTLGGSASLTLLGGGVTYAAGQSFIKHFSQGGSLADFNARELSVFFKQELAEGKRFIQEQIKSKRMGVTESA